MKKMQQPKKQPELIRKRIIEQAIILASENGTQAVSIQNVANGVGVTKGGVFHHFANKNILVDAMISEIILHLDQAVESLIAEDDTEYGKFTRAYIHSAFMTCIDGLVSPWTALTKTMISDPTFNKKFGIWFKEKLKQYSETDNYIELEFIRLATDGLWLQTVTDIINEQNSLHYKDELIKRTYLI